MEWIKDFLNGKVIAYDKMLHFLTGFLLSTLLSFTYIWINVSVLIVVAVGKEYYDLKVKKTMFDLKDCLATILGGIMAITFHLIAF